MFCPTPLPKVRLPITIPRRVSRTPAATTSDALALSPFTSTISGFWVSASPWRS